MPVIPRSRNILSPESSTFVFELTPDKSVGEYCVKSQQILPSAKQFNPVGSSAGNRPDFFVAKNSIAGPFTGQRN
jgi:hypothetical protein